MLEISGRVGYGLVDRIVNQVVQEGVIPNDQCSSIIDNCDKDKGDSLKTNNYRGIKLVDYVMNINLDEMSFGFVLGRSTTDSLLQYGNCKRSF